ncbi:MAG TPA: dephospho-CoA kinase [Stellaceae bacterium]|nr:dephospho-CoA kinase [Stellaceae bacterium]
MIVLGLTGSVGMGKSTAAAMLRRLGVPVHDADATVHRLMAPGGAAVAAVAKAFPDTRRKNGGGIDRVALGRRVFADAKAFQRLERILHPLVRQSQRRFLAAARARREPLVVLDVPLLFEGGGETRCDKVVVVSAPPAVQRARVMARPGMTEARFRAILAKQMPDREKRRRADYVVPSGLGRALTFRRLKRIVGELRHDAACARDSRTAH